MGGIRNNIGYKLIIVEIIVEKLGNCLQPFSVLNCCCEAQFPASLQLCILSANISSWQPVSFLPHSRSFLDPPTHNPELCGFSDFRNNSQPNH